MEHCPLAYYIINGIIITNPDEYITWFGFGVSWRAKGEQMTTSGKGVVICEIKTTDSCNRQHQPERDCDFQSYMLRCIRQNLPETQLGFLEFPLKRVCHLMSEIQITLTRDSACMSDDLNNHTKMINITPKHDTMNSIMLIAKEYLPNIAGYGHKWDCNLNGTKCAVINGNCLNITSIASASFTERNDLHFVYHSALY